MDGVELTTQEFAFLLGSLGATSVVDLDDPDLFPETEKEQQKTFERGFEQLIDHGWVETDSENPAEAGLNATLFQLVAVVAAPRTVISTSIRNTKGSPVRLMHYLGGGLIVELDAPAESRYRLAVVPTLEELGDRLSQFLGVDDAGNGSLLALERGPASKLRGLAAGGKLEPAIAGLSEAGVPEDQAATLAEALADGPSADIVGAAVMADEIEQTVRATLFGEGAGAWLIYYTDPDEDDLLLAMANSGSIEAMLTSWTARFGWESQPA